MPFTDRADAGRRLAQRLMHLRGGDNVVLGLPRGGVPVAFEVAIALDVPLDVIVVRKLGVPSQRELAMGAIGEGGVRIINNEVVRAARVTDAELAAITAREEVELDRRVHRFRGGPSSRHVREQGRGKRRQGARRRGENKLHDEMQARRVRAQGDRLGRQSAQGRGEEELHGQMRKGTSLIGLPPPLACKNGRDGTTDRG